MRDPLTAHTIVPLDESMFEEVAEAPPPPARTPTPASRIAVEPAASVSFPREDPLDAPDSVVVYLRQVGLVDEDEFVEIVTDSAPPVRGRRSD